jgi:dipeptidyl-peptidase-4
MAKFDRFARLRRVLNQSIDRRDFPQFKWAKDGQSFTYRFEKKRYLRRLDEDKPLLLTGKHDDQEPRARKTPERGRQYSVVFNADQSLKAYTQDRNVFISKKSGSTVIQVTHDGSADKRTKFGTASWVYGEELGVREAMFWSPDGKMLAFYGFDESNVSDFYLTLDETKLYDRMDIEAYPKAGTPNPIVDLYVYHLDAKTTTKIDVGFDSGAGPELGHYVYNVQWTPDGKELLFNRTNRKHCTMELVAANPETGKCRVVIRESHPQTWTDNSPRMWWIEDSEGAKTSFVWLAHRGNYRNLSLVPLDGSGEKAITRHAFDVVDVPRIDMKKGLVYYTARDGDNPYRIQLHRVKLDGSGDSRLTSTEFSHTVQINEACDAIIDTFENLTTPPKTVQLDADGKVVKVILEADRTRFDQRKLEPAERLIFKAADGKTDLYGYIMKPTGFDPKKKYPLVVTLYSGPESGTYSERFTIPHPLCELGFLVAWFDGRGTSGRGKDFVDEIYGKLGTVEIDDQAAGVRYLQTQGYVDEKRVGVYGTSYGGYATLMCMLRHPDLFKVGIACSSVTAWENYDSVYTERYMNTPQDNPDGYKAGSTMKYVKNLKGKLLLYYGTMDNNVHPANTHQLVAALNKEGKLYDMLVEPDKGHIGLDDKRTFAYFCEHLLGNTNVDHLSRAFNRRASQRRRLKA